MSCVGHFQGRSVVHRVDPRVRILVAAGFAVVTVACVRPLSLGAALAGAVGLVAVAGIPWRLVRRRLAEVNCLMLLLWLTVPATVPGARVWGIGPIGLSREGIALATAVTLKGNALVLALTALLGTMEIVAFGHALRHLRLPRNLVHLLLFTVRYTDVLHREFMRLTLAMRARGFRAGLNFHSLRTVGNLVGTLLVRSDARSERVLAAMRCRGFRGEFYVLDHFSLHRLDAAFVAVGAAALIGLAWVEWA